MESRHFLNKSNWQNLSGNDVMETTTSQVLTIRLTVLSHSTLTFGCVITYFLTSSGKSIVRLGNFSESSWRSTRSGGLLPFKYESTVPGMFLTSSTFNLTEVLSVSDMAIYTSYVMYIYHPLTKLELSKIIPFHICLGDRNRLCFANLHVQIHRIHNLSNASIDVIGVHFLGCLKLFQLTFHDINQHSDFLMFEDLFLVPMKMPHNGGFN